MIAADSDLTPVPGVASTLADAASSPIVDWPQIDHVLLDMDGTVLDLAFDIYFWAEQVPQHYAAARGLTLDAAKHELQPHFVAAQGRLDWYCLDYWSRLTGLDIAGLKRDIRHRIAPLAGAESFLRAVRQSGRQLWLVTNAHRDSWRLKMEQTGFAWYFDRIVSTHDFGAPKEDPRFWPALRERYPFDPARSLFVDDSQPVLTEALNHGFARVIAILRPDSAGALRSFPSCPGIEGLAELLPLN